MSDLLRIGIMANGVVVTAQTGSQSRTIAGYLAHLLEYPQWLIECDVDFTYCPYHGHYQRSVAVCESCGFGKGCRWLSRHASSTTLNAPLTELVDALQGAVDYVENREQNEHPRHCACSDCAWLRESRRFLRSISE